MEQLPREADVVRLDLLRINRNKEKDCTCKRPVYELDLANRRIACSCGAILDPFDVVVQLAERHEELNDLMNRRYKQAKQLSDYIKGYRDLQKR